MELVVRHMRERRAGRGGVAILMVMLILFVMIGALLVASFITWRQVQASRRITASVQAVASADSALECALYKVYKGPVLTEQEIADCTSEIGVGGEGILGDIEVTPVGAGFANAGDRLALQGVKAVAGYHGVKRALKAAIGEIDCNTVNWWGAVPNGAVPGFAGKARNDEVVGYIDDNGSKTFDEGDTPLTPADINDGALNGASGDIVFFPDTAFQINNDIQVSFSKTMKMGGLIYVRGSLTLINGSLDIRGGTVITNGSFNVRTGEIIGDDETLIQIINSDADFFVTSGLSLFGSCIQGNGMIKMKGILSSKFTFAGADVRASGKILIGDSLAPVASVNMSGTSDKAMKVSAGGDISMNTSGSIDIADVDFTAANMTLQWNKSGGAHCFAPGSTFTGGNLTCDDNGPNPGSSGTCLDLNCP